VSEQKGPGVLITAILGKPKPKGDQPAGSDKPEDKREDTDSQGLEAAAEDMLAAIKAEDAKALAKAFEAAMDCCMED
jgi:hypothetical protein